MIILHFFRLNLFCNRCSVTFSAELFNNEKTYKIFRFSLFKKQGRYSMIVKGEKNEYENKISRRLEVSTYSQLIPNSI